MFFPDAPSIITTDEDRQSRWSDKDGGWSLYAWTNQKRTVRCHVTGRPLPDVVWVRGDDEYVTSDDTYSFGERKEDDTTVISELQVSYNEKCSSVSYTHNSAM